MHDTKMGMESRAPSRACADDALIQRPANADLRLDPSRPVNKITRWPAGNKKTVMALERPGLSTARMTCSEVDGRRPAWDGIDTLALAGAGPSLDLATDVALDMDPCPPPDDRKVGHHMK
jgi:hypothetical protein